MRTDLLTTIKNLQQKIADTKKRADEQVAGYTKQLQKHHEELADRIRDGRIKIEDIEFKNHTKRKYTRRKKAETPPTEVNPVAPAAAGGQTPDEGTPIPPKASNKPTRQRRSRAEHEPLYVCKNGHEFEVSKDGKCPECHTHDYDLIDKE